MMMLLFPSNWQVRGEIVIQLCVYNCILLYIYSCIHLYNAVRGETSMAGCRREQTGSQLNNHHLNHYHHLDHHHHQQSL